MNLVQGLKRHQNRKKSDAYHIYSERLVHGLSPERSQPLSVGEKFRAPGPPK